MKFIRTIPPVAAQLSLRDLQQGMASIFCGDRYRKRLETEVKEYFGVRYAFFVSSGKAALLVILLALIKLSGKRQVIIPAYTCFSVPSVIMKARLEMVLCDIDPVTFDFDQNQLREAIDENVLCVIPNHLFGIPADMEGICSLCKERGVFVVEDAAQAMGGTAKGKKLGTLGDVGFFSLGRGKNITCGTGGIILTNSDQIAEAINSHYTNLEEPGMVEVLKELFKLMLMTIFIAPVFYWLPAGIPSLKLGQTFYYKDFPIKRLSRIHAGLLKRWRDRLERSNQIRTQTAAYFRKQLGIQNGHDASIPYLRLPVLMDSQDERDRIYSISQQRGLGISLMYPTAINEINEIKTTFNGATFPSAKEIAEKLLTIPTHHLLSERDKIAICGLFLQKQ